MTKEAIKTKGDEFQDKIDRFWKAFSSEDPGATADCAELAGQLIPEFEEESADFQDILQKLSLALDVDNVKLGIASTQALKAARHLLYDRGR